MNIDNGALTVRDQQNQDIDNAEQYAVNTVGSEALRSADKIIKGTGKLVDKVHNRTKPKQKKHPVQNAKRPDMRTKRKPDADTSSPGAPLHTQPEEIRPAPKVVSDIAQVARAPTASTLIESGNSLITKRLNTNRAYKQENRETQLWSVSDNHHASDPSAAIPDCWGEEKYLRRSRSRETQGIVPRIQPDSPTLVHIPGNEPDQKLSAMPEHEPEISIPAEPAPVSQPAAEIEKSPAQGGQEPVLPAKPECQNARPSIRKRRGPYRASTKPAQPEPDTQQVQELAGYSHSETHGRSSFASLHTRTGDSSLHLGGQVQLDTWAGNPFASSLQNQGAALAVAEDSGTALQTFQSAGQAAGNASDSAAANAAAPGVGAAVQATEKAVSKIEKTIENIAASSSRSPSSWGALAALFLLPLLVLAAIAGALRGGGSARNVGLSGDVLALMPQISAACQASGIPEYAPLVAAVIMQESGGRVADVGGDVMQCAEGMGLPVGTPVSLEESIRFGTSIIARNLQEAGAAGPTDIPAISLALQGYNFGNGYISWALARGGYSKENAREFSEMQAAAHGWSGYGDIDYVDHVLRYYQVSVGGMGDASAIADGRFAYPFPGHTWDTYPGHNGIDISFANCYGEPVYAVAAGTVRYTQDGWTPAHGVGGMWSFGNSVFIEHGDGWISAYGHLSALAVSSGETVTQGQLIGYIGSTGNSTGPHLHLALYHNGDAGIGGQNFAELAWPQYRR